jgi:MFS transporter, DHA1 family, multidrug resistance protein
LHSWLHTLRDQWDFLRQRRWLVVICLAVLVISGEIGMTSPIVSLYGQSFGVSTTLVGIYITSFALGRILVTIPTGRAADRWGRRRLLILGPFIIALALLGQALSSTFVLLTAFRLLQGVGSAVTMSAALLIVADRSPPAERGRNTSLFHFSLLLGLTIAPFFGGLLAQTYGLRAPFYASAALAVLVGPYLWWNLPETWQAPPAQPAPAVEPGQTVAAPRRPPQSAARELLSNTNFLLVALVGFIIFVGRAGARDTIMPLRGHAVLGLEASDLGLIFTAMAGLNLLAVPLAGLITDRLGRKHAIVLGLAVNGLALIFVGAASSLVWFWVGTLLMGFGKGFAEPSSVVYMTDISPANKLGASYGLYLTLRDLGLLVGPALLGRIADTAGLEWPLMLNAAGMFGIGLLFMFFARETLARPQRDASTI